MLSWLISAIALDTSSGIYLNGGKTVAELLEKLAGRLKQATDHAETLKAAHSAVSSLRNPAEDEDGVNGLLLVLIGALTVLKGYRLLTRKPTPSSPEE